MTDFHLTNISNCDDGWGFDTSLITGSAVIDFELICGEAWKKSFAGVN